MPAAQLPSSIDPAAAGAPGATDPGAATGFFQRVRIRFAKQGDLRLISHRDLVRTLERLFRRAAVDVRQSEGFHPKPRMMFPSALGLGIAGLDEVVDVDLAQATANEELLARLSAQAPPGLTILSIEAVPAGARKVRASCVSYEIPVPAERAAGLPAKVAALLAQATCPVERPGRAAPVDLRATLEALTLEQGVLRMKLRAIHEAQARPRDILAVLGLEDLESHGLLVRSRVELDADSHAPPR